MNMYLGGFNQFGEQMCIRWYFTFVVIIIFHILTPEKILLMKKRKVDPQIPLPLHHLNPQVENIVHNVVTCCPAIGNLP